MDEHFFEQHDYESIVPVQPPPVVQGSVLNLSFASVDIDLKLDPKWGCGGIAWPAAEVLCRYLVRRGTNSLNGKTVIDLGSGTGLCGLLAAKLGATAFVTDQAPLLSVMQDNVELNQMSSSCLVAELNWGEPIPAKIPRADVILAADCVYFEPAFPLLVDTLCDLVDNDASNPQEILFCYKKRRKADKRFFTLLKKRFRWTEVDDDPDREAYSRDAISLLRLHKL
ncbi:Protein-lysine N-methyltransferase EFM6 [Mycena indigotica]|uniref:Protein-lysine N-methyltransferase EFM6 n=1 Tax=Mycena indigotica TaxID=2126181 RepID=A0A8H6W1H2_9AGAR|nr:Protein-lysine N-methyltransferase EFM6 [Mycena indigotica]KAF7301547.1 Protein-lysine N-methyltransferase EFM6 [Mycena indigotica]